MSTKPTKPKVWNKRDPNVPPDAVYVGRPTKWGNMYVIGTDGNRAQVIALHKAHVEAAPAFIEMIKRELRGEDLVCWCPPEACHADTLLEIANE